MEGKKQQLKDLWEETFGDSKEFIDLFFDRTNADEHVVTIEKQGKIVSALYMLPYTLSFYNIDLPVAYVCGVATIPSERGKGLMRQLMEKARKEMEERNFKASILIPAEDWLFEYYRSMGYTEVFDYSVTHYNFTGHSNEESIYSFSEGRDVFPVDYFECKIRERLITIIHPLYDTETIIKDLYLSGGNLFTVFDKCNNPAGVAFAYKNENGILLKEIIFENKMVKEFLLDKIASWYKVNNIAYRTPAHSFPIRYGMLQILDKNRFIDIWFNTFPRTTITRSQLMNMDDISLTNYLFQYDERKAYMNLMLD